jgi:competence protein ComEA
LATVLAVMMAQSGARADPSPAPNATESTPGDAAGAWLAVDLNTANESRLQELPGIGPARAHAIIAFRQAHGAFTHVGQLLRIRGIGRAMLRRLRPLVTLGVAGPSATGTQGGASSRERDRVP